ncbi:MAG: hypothetical protein ACI392_05750 [Paludibacteraceae bacterium]
MANTNSSKTAWIAVAVVALLGMAAAVAYFWHKSVVTETEMAEMVEQMTYEKEQLEAEYQDLSLELEGYSYKTDNDSLLQRLNQEQTRVQLLLEELRTVKATNARRIAELKKELASVRKVLVYYIAQVDSLNTVNTKLVAENEVVTKKYVEASKTAEQLAVEKQMLTEKVSIAAQLDARNITVTTLNQREKKTTRLSKIALMQFDFVIAKNNTAEPGNKVVYLRILTPDDVVLQKKNSDVFRYENRDIAYSSKRTIEYGGEELPITMYWTVGEVLQAGVYRVDIFVDGHLIGTHTFELGK